MVCSVPVSTISTISTFPLRSWEPICFAEKRVKNRLLAHKKAILKIQKERVREGERKFAPMCVVEKH